MNTKTIARYSVSFGLAGCYLPDSHSGPFVVTRRTDLANAIRDELDMYEMPKSLINEVKLTRLWKFIKLNGSSVAHFSLQRKGYELAFHGLTEAEAIQMEIEGDC